MSRCPSEDVGLHEAVGVGIIPKTTRPRTDGHTGNENSGCIDKVNCSACHLTRQGMKSLLYPFSLSEEATKASIEAEIWSISEQKTKVTSNPGHLFQPA